MKKFIGIGFTVFSVWAITGCTLYKKDQVTDQDNTRTAQNVPAQEPVVVEQTVQAPPAPAAPDAVAILKDHPSTFLFKSGATGLQPNDLSRLDTIADVLKASPDSKVMIVGFTDAVGDPQKNLELSQKRSDSVKTYLETKGVSDKQLQVQAKGEEQASSRRANAEDRKVVVSLVG
jgi:outer membrane protein OmpA-like peptidoglycan-associated protein